MIRKWVGQTNNDAFYEAADKYGLLIWDDLSLANPVDGPNPADDAMFEENAIDKVRRIRSHPSVTFYVGRNESNPPEPLNTHLAALTAKYDGPRVYFPNSAGAPVGSGSGHGYTLSNPGTGSNNGIRNYFNDVALTLRSECGIPNVPTAESLKKFLEDENLWPMNDVWGLHDMGFFMNGPINPYMETIKTYSSKQFTVPSSSLNLINESQVGPNNPVANPNYNSQDPTSFINPANLATWRVYKDAIFALADELADRFTIDEFSTIAQMINFEHHKGLFEGLATRRGNGLLMWMSQSSWPSFMWQTYDYFLDTNGGYFGVKAGNQATHAVWDPRDDKIYLNNATPNTYQTIVSYKLYDLNGQLLKDESYSKTLGPDAYGIGLGNDDTAIPVTADFAASATPLVFIELTVYDAATGEELGRNVYWHNKDEYQNYKSLESLQKVSLTASVSARSTVAENVVRGGGNELYTITLTNNTNTPVVQTRIRTISSATGEDVLPVFYSDNYFALMPGESRTITVDFAGKYLEGGSPSFELSGWNTATATIG
jgi:hypothetical protein